MKNYDELMTSINEKAKTKIIQRKRRKKVLLSSALSLCLVVVIGVGALDLMPKPMNNNSHQTVDASLKGLAVDNFKLSDMKTQNGMAVDRLAAMKLSDFFQYSYAPDMFVYVRVLDTKQWEDKNHGNTTLKQTSSAKVIKEVWCKDKNIPENIVIEQNLSGGCMGDEKTNMLRKEGVYLLPLMKDQAKEKWYVNFDLDVLFEVDNQGKIWSHSQLEKFSIYDGKDPNLISDHITAMTSNANFPYYITTLGQMVVNWGEVGALAEVTVATAQNTEDKWGLACYKYTFGEFSPLLKTNNKNIGAISYKDSNAVLEVGSKYVIMLDYSEEGPYVENNRVARINEDGTISPINNDDENVFASFNGCTIEQITESIDKAMVWRREFGEK